MAHLNIWITQTLTQMTLPRKEGWLTCLHRH